MEYIKTDIILYKSNTRVIYLHLSDAFIQSDLHCIQVQGCFFFFKFFTFDQLLLSLGIEPMILALLAPCSTIWATGKLTIFLLHVKPHFYFDRLPWSFCVYTVYDASFLNWNGKILMKWLSQPVSVHVVRCRGRKSARVHVCFSICVTTKQNLVSAIHTYRG